jgi:hypothetical protein
MSFRIYGLYPDRRYYGRDDNKEDARATATLLVTRKHINHAEVWDDASDTPIWAVWRTETNRIKCSDD